MSNDKPEVGHLAHHKIYGDVTVTETQKRGKPPKEGWGGKVRFSDMDGALRWAKFADWKRDTAS